MAPLAQKRNASTSKSSKRTKGAISSSSLVPRLRGISRMRPNEVKYVDIQINQGASTTAAFILLNGIIPGNEFYNRVASTVFMQSIHLKLAFKQIVSNTAEVVRVLMIYDSQANVAFPTAANVISDLDISGSVSTTVYSGQNPQQSFRYKILMDRRQYCNNISASVVFPTSNELFINNFKKLNNLETRYNKGTAGDVTDISTGSLFLLILAETSTAGSPATFIKGSARLRYLD